MNAPVVNQQALFIPSQQVAGALILDAQALPLPSVESQTSRQSDIEIPHITIPQQDASSLQNISARLHEQFYHDIFSAHNQLTDPLYFALRNQPDDLLRKIHFALLAPHGGLYLWNSDMATKTLKEIVERSSDDYYAKMLGLAKMSATIIPFDQTFSRHVVGEQEAVPLDIFRDTTYRFSHPEYFRFEGLWFPKGAVLAYHICTTPEGINLFAICPIALKSEVAFLEQERSQLSDIFTETLDDGNPCFRHNLKANVPHSASNDLTFRIFPFCDADDISPQDGHRALEPVDDEQPPHISHPPLPEKKPESGVQPQSKDRVDPRPNDDLDRTRFALRKLFADKWSIRPSLEDIDEIIAVFRGQSAQIPVPEIDPKTARRYELMGLGQYDRETGLYLPLPHQFPDEHRWASFKPDNWSEMTEKLRYEKDPDLKKKIVEEQRDTLLKYLLDPNGLGPLVEAGILYQDQLHAIDEAGLAELRRFANRRTIAFSLSDYLPPKEKRVAKEAADSQKVDLGHVSARDYLRRSQIRKRKKSKS